MFGEQRRERRGRRRAGRSTARMLRREAWRRARCSWRRLLVFLVGWVVLTVVVSGLQQTEFLRGLFAGLMLGLLGLFVMVFLVATGIAHRQMGGAAEQWTAELFKELDRGRWFVVHDVSFEQMNVDHVLVGPGRIYAVETKWTSWHGNPRFLQSARWCAERGARKLQRLLASRGLSRKVTAFVVVWGPGTEGMSPEPVWKDGVGLVAGVHAEAWLARLRSSGSGLARDLSAEQAISGFITARDTYADAHKPVPQGHSAGGTGLGVVRRDAPRVMSRAGT